jgi:hypothetical protein
MLSILRAQARKRDIWPSKRARGVSYLVALASNTLPASFAVLRILKGRVRLSHATRAIQEFLCPEIAVTARLSRLNGEVCRHLLASAVEQ